MTLWVILEHPASEAWQTRRTGKIRRWQAGSGLLAHSSSQGAAGEHHGRIKMGILGLLSTRLFQPEAKDAFRFLARFDQLAAGGLAEMLEILDRARIGSEYA